MSGNISTAFRKITCGEMVWTELCLYNFQQQVVDLCFEPLGSRSRDSVVSIVTHYGLDGLGIESRWGRFSIPSRLALRPTQPPIQWVLGLSWG
jgi:hypothetical protein